MAQVQELIAVEPVTSGRPGAQLARRPLHFFVLADCSGSMASGGKMAALNTAIREVLPHLADTSANNPHAEVMIRAIRFSTGASWHVAEPTSPEQLDWEDLSTGGYTDLGSAIELLCSVLTVPPMETRALPPAIVLVSDGMPTDDFERALKQLLELPWGARSVRMAVAIGHDAALDTLSEFIADPNLEPVTASNPEQLVLALRWASVAVARAASSLAAPPAPQQLIRAWTPESEQEVVW
jgi:uncharacterized protein YegL